MPFSKPEGSELTMEFQKKTSEPVIPRKRSLDETNDSKLEEFIGRKTVSKFPPSKIRSGEQIVRDFPPGCGIKENYQILGNDTVDHNNLKSIKPTELERNKSYLGSRPDSKVKFWDPIACSKEGNAQKPNVTTTVVIRRKPLKKLDNVHTTFRKMTSYCDDKLVDSNQPYEYNELKSIKPRELGRNEPSFGSRRAGKGKFWDPDCLEEGDEHKLKYTAPVVSWREQVRREKIREAMIIFGEMYTQLFQMNSLKPKEEKLTPWRITMYVAKIAKQKLSGWMLKKVIGGVCGVQVGDKFKFRSQLQMVGLHCQPQSGIDYTMIEGRNLAISIVDSHRYSNERKSCEMLIYCGHGGLELLEHKLPPEDQKLERGNLALKNSMIAKNPVRVIRKVGGFWKNAVFVYDGLYIVKDYTQKKGAKGNMVFKFKLNRVPGQPQLHKMLNAS